MRRISRRVLLVGLPLLAFGTRISLAAAHPAPLQTASEAALPRVRLITTGGTISNRSGGRLSPDELVALIPDLGQLVEAETESFANIASNALTLDQWVRLARRIDRVFSQDPDTSAIVVTSGTDTLEELAFFLHLTVRHARPVVVVGAMRRPEALGYDGAANLRQAFQVAADPGSRGRGVLVVLNGTINSAREVTKTDATSLNAFETRGYGVLGIVAGDGVVYYRRVERRHTARSEFDVSRLAPLPRIDIVMAYQGASGDLIRAAVNHGAAGVVIAGAGAGATSRGQREAIAYAYTHGVFVVMTTRTGRGRIAPSRSAASRDGGAPARLRISGEDLAPVKARILLMLALGATRDANDIQRMFGEY